MSERYHNDFEFVDEAKKHETSIECRLHRFCRMQSSVKINSKQHQRKMSNLQKGKILNREFQVNKSS